MVLNTLVFNCMPDKLKIKWFLIHWFATICLINYRYSGGSLYTGFQLMNLHWYCPKLYAPWSSIIIHKLQNCMPDKLALQWFFIHWISTHKLALIQSKISKWFSTTCWVLQWFKIHLFLTICLLNWYLNGMVHKTLHWFPAIFRINYIGNSSFGTSDLIPYSHNLV